jgi:WD40 repeat protein
MALSTDGRLAACGSYSHVDLYDIPSGRLKRRLLGPSGGIYSSVFFTPHASSPWAVSLEGEVWKWDVASGALARPLSVAGDRYGTMAYLKNGLLVQASCGEIRLRDQNLVARTPSIKFAAISPRTLAVERSGDCVATALITKAPQVRDKSSNIAVWNLKTRQLVQQWSGHSGEINALAFASTSLLASGGTDHLVKFWEHSQHCLTNTKFAPTQHPSRSKTYTAPQGVSPVYSNLHRLERELCL